MKFQTIIPALMLGCALAAQAGVYDNSYSSGFANSGNVPVGNLSGWSDSETINGETGTIGSVSVDLNISGGFNGSLYGYLEYNGVLVTLLNRVGVVSGNPFGYGDSGFDITLSSSGASSVHSYQSGSYSVNGSGQLTGTWQPDGNTVSPLASPSSFSSSPSGTGLNALNGFSPDGTWTLFLADVVSGGGQPQVLSYSLDITTVPEPVNLALGIFGGVMGVVALARSKRGVTARSGAPCFPPAG